MGHNRFWLGWLVVLLLVGCGGGETAVPATPTLSPQAVQGQQIFTRECGSCHSFSPDTIIVGPSLAGVANRAGSRVAGQDAKTYLLTSILRPGDYLVDGFDNLMPATFGKQLTGENIDALVAYLLEAG
ncbi:MAG: cytochrome c [Chloroflexota bacterium]